MKLSWMDRVDEWIFWPVEYWEGPTYGHMAARVLIGIPWVIVMMLTVGMAAFCADVLLDWREPR